MARYFYNELPNRPVEINGRTYQFELVSRTAGTYEVTTPEAEGDLAAVAGQRRGITEIPKEEYDQLQAQKKTTPTSLHSGSLSSGQPRAVLPQASRIRTPALADKEGVAYAANDPKPEIPEAVDPSKLPQLSEIAAQVKKVGPVNSPHPVAADKRKADK